MTYRREHDAMGEVAVPADRLWGAQTQRSCEHFRIGVGRETMPQEIIAAFGLLKQAAARANRALLPFPCKYILNAARFLLYRKNKAQAGK